MEQLRMSKENTILVQCIRHEPEDMRSLMVRQNINYDMEDICGTLRKDSDATARKDHT